MRFRSSNKYGAIKSTYNGIVYHSKREAAYAQELTLRKKAGDIKDWKRQIPFVLTVKGKKICTYIIDFAVQKADATWEYIEIKSEATAKEPYFRLKWKLFRALYPDLDARIES